MPFFSTRNDSGTVRLCNGPISRSKKSRKEISTNLSDFVLFDFNMAISFT